MKKNRGRILSKCLAVATVWGASGAAVFAAETEGLQTVTATVNQASVITQSGSLYVIGYLAVGIAMAGFGFVVRKKI